MNTLSQQGLEAPAAYPAPVSSVPVTTAHASTFNFQSITTQVMDLLKQYWYVIVILIIIYLYYRSTKQNAKKTAPKKPSSVAANSAASGSA